MSSLQTLNQHLIRQRNRFSSLKDVLRYGIILLLFHYAPFASALVNGGAIDDAITVPGQEKAYSFHVKQGANFQLRATDLDGSLVIRLTLYDPNGSYVTYAQSSTVTQMSYAARMTGDYKVVVSDWSSGRQGTGIFRMYFAHMPGANDGGLLTDSMKVSDSMQLGELDSYTLQMKAGENFQVRVASTDEGGFVPRMTLYDPNGKYVTYAQGNPVANISYSARIDGTYTIVVNDWSSGWDGIGKYNLYFVRVPGANDGGALVSGGVKTSLLELGELESYTLELKQGENFQIRTTDVAQGDLTLRLTLYDPNGKYVTYAQGATVTQMSYAARMDGIYTVVVNDWSSGWDAVGTYKIYYAKAPGSTDGGKLSSGVTNNNQLEMGDLDSFQFYGNKGERIELTLNDTSGSDFYPRVVLYDPTGKYITYRQGNSISLVYYPKQTGFHTVIISDWSRGWDGHGEYNIGYIGEAQ